MSNDINYDLRFRSDKRSTLTQVKDYLTEKKRQWDGRGSKTAKDLLKEAGLKHPAQVVTWGFEFGSIRKQADGTYSADVSSWANENSLGNVWISGDKGELKFLLDRFPGLTIGGEFDGDYGKGLVDGYELIYQEQEDDDSDENIDKRVKCVKKTNKKASNKLFVRIDEAYEMSAEDFRKALEDGADPNAQLDGRSLLEILLRTPQIFAHHSDDDADREKCKTLELLLSYGMKVDDPAYWPEILIWVKKMPDQVREFAEKRKLKRATDEETRLEVIRFGLKQGVNWLPSTFFKLAGPLAQKDPQIVELALKVTGWTLHCASDAVRADKRLVLVAVGSWGSASALQYASPRLKDDPDVVFAAVQSSGKALQFASNRLRNDPRIVLAAVHEDGTVLEHASKRLRSDPSVVRAAVASDGKALEFASTAIKNNKDIVKVAVTTSGGYAFMHASKELQRDPEIRKMHESHQSYVIL